MEKIENYYRFHSRIYDATRWSFLFGRQTILETLPCLPPRPRIMEVGCGTGKNIVQLENHFPDAKIVGIDLSEAMLTLARKKINISETTELKKKIYGSETMAEGRFDLILLSYTLTMTGDIEKIIDQLSRDLKPKGYVAVVDFNTSPFGWFRRWMNINHVDLSGRILPLLMNYFQPLESEIRHAFVGLWSYFLFVGRHNGVIPDQPDS